MDYEDLLSHRGHEISVYGEGEEDAFFRPRFMVLKCTTCDLILLSTSHELVSTGFRACEVPECEVKLPPGDMVQLPGGEWLCPPHARDAERMP